MNKMAPTNTIASRSYAGFFWQFFGLSLNTILSVAHIMIMARLLTPEVFGQFAIVSILVALTSIVAEFGLGHALVQARDISDNDISLVFAIQVLIGLIFFVLLCTLSSHIGFLFNSAVDPMVLAVLAVSLLLLPLGLASKSLLLRSMAFNKIFIATNLSYFVGMILVGVTLAYLGFGIWSLVIGTLMSHVVSSVYYFAQAPIKFSFRFEKNLMGRYFRYGMGQTSVEGVNYLSLMMDKIILAKLSTVEFLGLYERSQRIQQMPRVFTSGIFDTVLFSALSRFTGDSTRQGKHFFEFLTVASIVGVYLSVSLFTFSEEIVNIVLGRDWVEAITVLQLLSALIFFQLVSRLCDTYVRATGEFKKAFKIKIFHLTTVVLLVLAGFYLFEISGVLVGILVASAMHAALMLRICRRYCSYPIGLLWQRLRPCIVVAIILLAKNSLVVYIGYEGVAKIALVVFSDVVIFALLSRSRFLLGEDNRQYLVTRGNEISELVNLKFRYK